MQQSEKIDQIAAALCEMQFNAQEPAKDGTNPHLRNKYVTLAGAWATLRPQLHAHGLSVVQIPCGSDGEVGVVTQLCHVSGQWMRHEVRIRVWEQKGLNDAQVVGSVISYLRRYSLLAITGLSHDDDDGASAGTPRGGGTYKDAERAKRYVEEAAGNIGKMPSERGDYIIPVGKHKGLAITNENVPRGYLEWVLENVDESSADKKAFRAAARVEVDRRLAAKEGGK